MSRMMRNSANARRNTLLSLGLPILVAAVILIVLVRAIFSGKDASTTRSGTESVTVVPKTENSEIFIYMSGDSKKKIEGEEKMFPTDNRLEVKSGDADLVIDGSSTKLSTDRLTEIAYRGKNAANLHSFELFSSYIWVEATGDDTVFKLKSVTVEPKAGSVVALSQNAVGSNVYVLKGRVTVSTETSNTDVGVNQMVTVLTSEAKTQKLPESIRPIDSFFRTENIYLKHNGDSYLLASSPLDGSGSSESGSLAGAIPWAAAKGIIFVTPEDESSVETSSIDIEGKILLPSITKITINEKEAKIDVAEKTFSFGAFPLPTNANNLVYKAFDSEGTVIAKGVITVYSSMKKAESSPASKPTVTTFPISDKEFQIVAPTDNPYKTIENVVRIEGRLPKGAVKYVTVNGFRLSKFPQYGTYWYYFANKDYGTMNDGINTYEIKYYDGNDSLLKTSQFIIVKETPEPTPVAAPAPLPEVKETPDTSSGSSAG